jgi:enoyl-CoA hydratase
VDRQAGVDNPAGDQVAAATAERAPIRIGQDGAAATVTLDRPETLNALTDAMRRAIAEHLPRWERAPGVYAVLVSSTSDRAFCAGGDLREMTVAGRTGPPESRAEARRQLAMEYALNWALECFTKPTVSLIDGSVMGSGVGISLYGTHRIAGERYRFSMPETGVGLIPDCGVAHAFARMPSEIGMYLALTGRTIGAADAYRLGLVTHCIPASRFGEIRAGLVEADCVDPMLDERHVAPGPGELEVLAPVIARCFAADTVEEIVARLGAERGSSVDWARVTATELGRRSPTALKLTHRAVRAARTLDLRGVLIQDYRVVSRCLEAGDLYEGVRALLIDRDRAPKWQPARLEDVTEAMVNAHFAPLGADELDLKTRIEMQAVKT